MYKKNQNICYFKRGLRLFKGLFLLFLLNAPGATFIQGGTFIPESRVNESVTNQDRQLFATLRYITYQ